MIGQHTVFHRKPFHRRHHDAKLRLFVQAIHRVVYEPTNAGVGRRLKIREVMLPGGNLLP